MVQLVELGGIEPPTPCGVHPALRTPVVPTRGTVTVVRRLRRSMAGSSTWSNNRLTDRRSRGARLSPPCRSPADVRSPGCGYAHPERLLRGHPTVGGGFTNPSPVPIRLRGRSSLPSCLSLPVAFLWRSWRRESCCSCHPCLYQPWRPLQLSVALLVPPDLRPPLRCLTSKRPLPQRELLDPQFLRCKNSS